MTSNRPHDAMSPPELRQGLRTVAAARAMTEAIGTAVRRALSWRHPGRRSSAFGHYCGYSSATFDGTKRVSAFLTMADGTARV